jgi:hypothetical protein
VRYKHKKEISNFRLLLLPTTDDACEHDDDDDDDESERERFASAVLSRSGVRSLFYFLCVKN